MELNGELRLAAHTFNISERIVEERRAFIRLRLLFQSRSSRINRDTASDLRVSTEFAHASFN